MMMVITPMVGVKTRLRMYGVQEIGEMPRSARVEKAMPRAMMNKATMRITNLRTCSGILRGRELSSMLRHAISPNKTRQGAAQGKIKSS
jgi:hypothetical protein